LPPEWLAEIELADMSKLDSMLRGLRHQKMNSRVRRRVRRSIEAVIELRKRAARETMAEYGGAYIRDRLREQGFVRQLFPPQQVPDHVIDLHQQGKISEATLMGKIMAHSFQEEMKRLKDAQARTGSLGSAGGPGTKPGRIEEDPTGGEE
jgi:hypothetical protein